MKAKRAARKLRSLYFRQRLLEKLPELEMELMELVEETGMKFFAGFKIEITEGQLRLAKVEVNSEQLNLEFIEKEGVGISYIENQQNKKEGG